jgi:hypothetical protein
MAGGSGVGTLGAWLNKFVSSLIKNFNYVASHQLRCKGSAIVLFFFIE